VIELFVPRVGGPDSFQFFFRPVSPNKKQQARTFLEKKFNFLWTDPNSTQEISGFSIKKSIFYGLYPQGTSGFSVKKSIFFGAPHFHPGNQRFFN